MNVCIYCSAFVERPARHFSQKHREEPRIARILENPDHGERVKLFEAVVADGNWAHNQKVLQRGEGELVLKRGTSSKESVSNSAVLPCAHCKQLYRKTALYKHFNVCSKNPNCTANKGRAQKEGQKLLPKEFVASERTQTYILNRTRNDDVAVILKSDSLLIHLSNVLVEGCFTQSAFKHLRHRMRALTRLLMHVRVASGEPDMTFSGMLKCIYEYLLPALETFTKNFRNHNNLDQLYADLKKAYEDVCVHSKSPDQKAEWKRY